MATDIQLHKQQAQELSNKLWAIANDLRGTMDASKFKDYIQMRSLLKMKNCLQLLTSILLITSDTSFAPNTASAILSI